ncbi:hypothetical protein UlMin_006654 [Ulmus minor]
MPSFVSEKKRVKKPIMSLSDSVKKDTLFCTTQLVKYVETSILPGLPDDVAKHCLALMPCTNFPVMASVIYHCVEIGWSTRGVALYFNNKCEGKESHSEVLDCTGQVNRLLPLMPGALKFGFGVVVLNGKLLVLAGYSLINRADVYQYDSCLNSWSKLDDLNVARYEFACAEVNGMVYVAGGYGRDGNSLCSAEVYNLETSSWSLISSIRHPRWGCFACGLEGKLYLMGGRSSFTIGNSKFVDVYNPKR